MQHIDEHTLELYILGSELVEKRTSEIRAHINGCSGCKTLAERMEAFYRDAEGSFQASEDYVGKKNDKNTAMVRINQALEQHYDPFTVPTPYGPKRPISKIFYFIRRHPIAVSLSSFAMFAVVGWLLNDFLGNGPKGNSITDKNPSYPNLNTESGIVEIYNKENQLLWSIPSSAIYRLSHEIYAKSIKNINIADIDGDQINEVVSILPFGNNPEHTIPLSIFSAEGKLVKKVFFNENVQFRDTKYDGTFCAERLLCVDSLESGKGEIIVTTSNGRSPAIINRVSSDGATKGQYYHFGNGSLQYIRAGEKYKIVFLGQNDTDDPDSLSYAVVSILEPSKLIGKSEASDSRGFGLGSSQAEIYLIRFPLSDMNILWNTPCYASKLKEAMIGSRKIYSIWVSGMFGGAGLGSGSHPSFEYIFDENMKILEVKYDIITVNLRKEFIAGGKMSGAMDQAYLGNLKNQVKYWNGTAWQKEPTTVKHNSTIGQ